MRWLARSGHVRRRYHPGRPGPDVTMVQDGGPRWRENAAALADRSRRLDSSSPVLPRRLGQALVSGDDVILFYSFQLAALPAHLAARRLEIPDDVGAIFDIGCLYEAFTGQRCSERRPLRTGARHLAGRAGASRRAGACTPPVRRRARARSGTRRSARSARACSRCRARPDAPRIG